MVSISVLKIDDLDEYLDLVRDTVNGATYYSEDARDSEAMELSTNIPKLIDDPNFIFLVAKDGLRVVGFLFGNYDGKTFRMEWIGIKPQYRKEGVALDLTRHMEGLVRGNAHKIWVDTRTTNEESISILVGLGYEKMAELKRHWYEQDYFLWHKFLD